MAVFLYANIGGWGCHVHVEAWHLHMYPVIGFSYIVNPYRDIFFFFTSLSKSDVHHLSWSLVSDTILSKSNDDEDNNVY